MTIIRYAAASPHRVTPSLPPPSSSAGLGRANILIVDDDRLSSNVVAAMVQREGHVTFSANTWTEAVEVFSKEEIDLVLMDAVMPTVDGFKLTGILRQRTATYVPVVFITGLADSKSRLKGVESGADDYLVKPIEAIELRIRLMAMLRIRRLTRALEVRTHRLAQLANIDNLTGLLNRRSLEERLNDEVSQAILSETSLAALMIDVDHFKAINDRHGHAVGDVVLASVGQVLDETVRATDLAFRYGGEEFIVLCPETTARHAGELAERIRVLFRQRTEALSPAGLQTISIGVASTTDLGLSKFSRTTEFETGLLQAADRALYQAKNGGRDCIVVAGAPTAAG